MDKILGPGNQYVTAAKMVLQNSEAMVAIDMPAGPSEVLVIADSTADPAFIAADLLSQAEHGPDSQARPPFFVRHRVEPSIIGPRSPIFSDFVILVPLFEIHHFQILSWCSLSTIGSQFPGLEF